MNNNIIPACIIGAGLFAIALKPAPQSAPIPQADPVAVVTASVTEQTDPYIVEYDFVSIENQSNTVAAIRVWSDGIIEAKHWFWDNVCSQDPPLFSCSDWIVLPDSSEGYACRSDIDGDRKVDFDDLLMVISDWSQPAICNPHPEIECGKPLFQPPA